MDRKGGNEPKPGSAPGRKTRGLDIDFRLATFNVLTDGADWMPFVGWLMKSEKRFQTTLDMLSDLGASVVGLNECTENFHAKLQAHPLASRYHVYHTPLKPMGNMLLAKREIKDFKSVKIPRLKREVACGVVHDGETRVLAAAAHLTARSDARCVERRKTELRYLVKTCATAFKGKFDSLVIMGDLNFHVSEENKQLETLHAHAEGLKPCIDVWSSLRPTEDGFTYGAERNKLITSLRFWEHRWHPPSCSECLPYATEAALDCFENHAYGCSHE
mmetsp:Transcript_14631/g.27764  ORF Transcript_14631/g.27764 Transcript_14631/m.27764 type:complete len:274 (-) Transcript_14631:383-1204(-)|eukprot:CAMPEP_0170166636 /NCGR_PEP_ID=MMETSP0040_2-20121228/271_1 /TAXON_ID=641309 /ORGANISM="Lotharella oceanica, Strain CCMP622" /LENGTH=273 /DNA_ID=CAMNT_0010404421 /DNA_START=183 /DNA_END=1004 /DNA_ORIENTATION=-